MISTTMIFPFAWTFYFHENNALWSFLYSMGIGAAVGTLLIALGKGTSKEFYRKEGLATVALSWITVGLLGALPFYISGSIPDAASAIFESISGFTTTGSSILSNIESLPMSILFWRSLIQWLGGMGIIILFIAIFPFLHIGPKQMYKMEVPGVDKSSFIPQVKHAAIILWSIYFSLTVLEIIALKIAGMSFFDSICHAFTTMPTGGFSPRNASIAHYNSPLIDGIIVIFMLLAGINFALYFSLIKGNYDNLFKDIEVKVYLLIIVAAISLVTIDLLLTDTYGSFLEALRFSSFQVTSMQTTTGYATANFDLWPSFSKTLLVTLMIIGACTGSTGGGSKVMRVILVFKHAYVEILKFIKPNLVKVLKINNNVVGEDAKNALFGFYSIFFICLFFATLIMCALGLDLVTALTAVIATIWNIGPGLGKVGAVENFGFIPAMGKYVLSFCMILGRLEIFTIIAIFIPRLWRE